MSSYADIAAKGPKQSDADKVPDAVPEIAHEESGASDRVEINAKNPIPSYADQQLAHERAEQAAAEAEQAAKREADKAIAKVREFEAMTEAELANLEKKGGEQWDDFRKYSSKKYKEWKKEAGTEAEKAKKEIKKDAKKAEQWAEKNKNNPVILGNAVVVAALGGVLGIGAYRMHQAGTLTWNVAGAWAGAVGLFAVGDYFLSSYLFQKYPPK